MVHVGFIPLRPPPSPLRSLRVASGFTWQITFVAVLSAAVGLWHLYLVVSETDNNSSKDSSKGAEVKGPGNSRCMHAWCVLASSAGHSNPAAVPCLK